MLSMRPPYIFNISLIAVFFIGFMSSIAFAPLLAIIQANAAPEIQEHAFTSINILPNHMSSLGLLNAEPLVGLRKLGHMESMSGEVNVDLSW